MSTQPNVELSVVLPAYQEAESLSTLLPRLRRTVEQLGVSFETMFVEGALGTAGTEDVCRGNEVRYERRHGGSQYGAAVRTAQRVARGAFVIFMDADGSHRPEFVHSLWEWRDNADLVIASRYVPGGRTENPAILILMSRIVNMGFRMILGLRCHDVSNSFWL